RGGHYRIRFGTAGWRWRRTVAASDRLSNAARYVTRPAVFLLLSPCICLISATISNGGLRLAGIFQSSDIAVSWMTWWGGDTLGVLVVLPIMAPRGTRGRQFSLVAPDQFTAEQNIAHYRSRLQMGAQPETRAILLNLLLHEEKQLGRTREQLVKIDS